MSRTPASGVLSGKGMVVMPAHNEERDIAGVIDQIKEFTDFDVVVVDDCSTDQTRKVATDAGAQVIPLSQQLGAWGAMQTGMRFAYMKGCDYVVTMDADGQHEAVWINELLKPVVSGRADVSIGSCIRRGSNMRKIAWIILKAASGLALEDITSGFRVYNRESMELLAAREATLLEYQDVGVLVMLRNAGLKVQDIEVTMLPRRSGASRVYHSWFTVVYYMFHTVLLGFSKRKSARRIEATRAASRGQ